MKVDFHCHTLKIKNNEAETRNVTGEVFKEKIEESGVEIVAITNHNHFDMEQYQEFKKLVKNSCQLWPGIELDVVGKSGTTGHLILISNPEYVEVFDEKLKEIISGESPDKFIINLANLYIKIKELDLIYVAHCFKAKELPFDDIEEFENSLDNPKRLFREPSQLTSATILQSNKYRVIMGTDVINWSDYEKCNFGELKFPIKDYNGFVKMIEKDITFLNDTINKQFSEIVTVYGIADTKKYAYQLPIYNDVNIVFGDKGSGKSEILKSLKDYYTNVKNEEPVYYESSSRDQWYLDLIAPDDTDYDMSKIGNSLADEFEEINNFIDTNPIPLKNYREYIKKKSNKASKIRMKSLGIKKSNLYDKSKYENIYNDYKNIVDFIIKSKKFQTKLIQEEQKTLETLLLKLCENSYSVVQENWINQKTEYLFDDFIDNLSQFVSQCVGEPVQPTETGFFKFAKNRLDLYRNSQKIFTSLKNNHKSDEFIGDLADKGKIYLQYDHILLNYNNNDIISSAKKDGGSKYILSSSNKVDLQKFITELSKISRNYCNYDLDLTTIKDLYSEKNIKSLSEFIAIKKYFRIGTTPYVPSSGEKSILALQHDVLSKTNKKIFLIDEPELGLGSTYINATIIPLLRDLAKAKKIIVLATHDANIAVRTRPLNSILKLTNNNTYNTYVGNMFTNILQNESNKDDVYQWKDASLKYLEGGEPAFDERGELYE